MKYNVAWPGLEELFDEVYGYMVGFLDSNGSSKLADLVPNEFESARCGDLYEIVYHARLNLSEQAGMQDGKEPEELCKIYQCYEEMQEILCRKSFEYGWFLAMRQNRENNR